MDTTTTTAQVKLDIKMEILQKKTRSWNIIQSKEVKGEEEEECFF